MVGRTVELTLRSVTAALFMIPAGALGQPFTPSLDPDLRTTVLVLGTAHLNVLGDRFTPALVEPLLRRLEAFKPDAIGIESMPPSELANMAVHPEYASVVERFASKRLRYGRHFQEELGLTWWEAADSADRALQRHRDTSYEPDQRVQVIVLLLAAYDDLSAQLQWAYLPREFREGHPGLPDSVRTYLNERAVSPNETTAIGVLLAHRLGLQRLHYIDDHYDKDLYLRILPSLMAELEGDDVFAAVASDPFFKETEERLQDAVSDGDLLSYYRFINGAEYGRAEARLQWDVWLRTDLASGLDRTRLALWEVRNLNMASHIRRATAMIPSGRLLVIVGNGHRRFLEQYLGLMVDIRLAHIEDLFD